MQAVVCHQWSSVKAKQSERPFLEYGNVRDFIFIFMAVNLTWLVITNLCKFSSMVVVTPHYESNAGDYNP